MNDTGCMEVINGGSDDLNELRSVVFEIRSFRTNSVE